MADLVACGLLVPGKDLVIAHGAGGFGHGNRGGHQIGGLFGEVRQAQKPIRADAKGGRTFRDQLRIGQPRALILEQL